MQWLRKHSDVIGFGLFVLILLVAGLAMNRYEVRAAVGQESLVPLDTSFTYQGYLEDDGSPVNGTCDFQFELYDAETGGEKLGITNEIELTVDGGVFSTRLDFGHVFSRHRRWLAVAVRCPAGSGSFTTLSPRTEVLSAPLSNALPNLYIDPNGWFGINSNYNVLSYMLDVNGHIRAKDGIYATNSAGTNPAVIYSDSSGGVVSVQTITASKRAQMEVSSIGGPGLIQTWGANGKLNVKISSLGSNSNHGYINVRDEEGDAQAGLYVNSSGQGVVFGDVLSFPSTSTRHAGTEIWYSSLEGPEAAAYVRGTAKLVGGQATILLPDHFLDKASEEGLTVQVTPLSAKSLGLAVIEKSLDGIKVRELQEGGGSYEFDFFVTAVRKGFEDYEVMRSVSERNGTSDSLDESKGDTAPDQSFGTAAVEEME